MTTDKRWLRATHLLLGVSIGVLTCSVPAAAQDNPVVTDEAAATDEGDGEIVVTGSRLRGVAPVGSTVIQLGREEIEDSSAVTVDRMNLYVIQGVAKDVSIGRIFKGVMPFLASDFVHLFLLILIPGMALWLPTVMQ